MIKAILKKQAKTALLYDKNAKTMISKRKFMKECNDSIFIFNAAVNGDPQAQKIYSLIVEINTGEQDIKKNFKDYSPELKLELLNLLKTRKKERDILIYRYGLQNKRAKTYLDTLKREKREERKVTKQTKILTDKIQKFNEL